MGPKTRTGATIWAGSRPPHPRDRETAMIIFDDDDDNGHHGRKENVGIGHSAATTIEVRMVAAE